LLVELGSLVLPLGLTALNFELGLLVLPLGLPG
jgi:hypothetical protein